VWRSLERDVPELPIAALLPPPPPPLSKRLCALGICSSIGGCTCPLLAQSKTVAERPRLRPWRARVSGWQRAPPQLARDRVSPPRATIPGAITRMVDSIARGPHFLRHISITTGMCGWPRSRV